MAKVVVTSSKPKTTAATRGRASVSMKRVRDNEGQLKTLRTIDVGSGSFGSDLQYVFSRNVAKARRENKRTVGSADVAPTKR